MIAAQRDGGILALTIDRQASYNALDVPTLRQLLDILAEAAGDSTVRAVTIVGAGKAFCSGADTDEWAAAVERGALETYGWTPAAHAAFHALYTLPKPTIALLNGMTVGAGLDLALACDLRIAGDRAKFLPGYTGMGYAPDAGASWHLPRLIGEQEAKAFLFLNEFWDAATALAKGLVLEMVGHDQLQDRGREVAARLAAGPTRAYGETKVLLAQASINSLVDQLKLEAESAIRSGRTRDGQEAVAAVREARRPHFTGK